MPRERPLAAGARTLAAPLAVALFLGTDAREARPQAAGASPLRDVDAAAFVERALPIGNEGSTTPNARRYAISPDWTTLAAPRDDGSVQLFDVATGEPAARALEGGFKVGTLTTSYAFGSEQPSFFGFSSDGSLIVWSWGKKLAAWRVATREIVLRQEIEDFETNPRGEGVHVGPQGRFITWFTKWGTTLWDAPQLVLGNDGRFLCDSCQVTDIWDLSQATPLLMQRTGLLPTTSGRPALSPDGRRLATVGYGPTASGKKGIVVQIWNLEALRAAAETKPE